mmetsp:Transcript_9070/g.29990  ORF Transcript_9070/g.29990 Transcript_9070/m.29990 type:complete len:255 (-) Transcript_9070:80-844(-)
MAGTADPRSRSPPKRRQPSASSGVTCACGSITTTEVTRAATQTAASSARHDSSRSRAIERSSVRSRARCARAASLASWESRLACLSSLGTGSGLGAPPPPPPRRACATFSSRARGSAAGSLSLHSPQRLSHSPPPLLPPSPLPPSPSSPAAGGSRPASAGSMDTQSHRERIATRAAVRGVRPSPTQTTSVSPLAGEKACCAQCSSTACRHATDSEISFASGKRPSPRRWRPHSQRRKRSTKRRLHGRSPSALFA